MEWLDLNALVAPLLARIRRGLYDRPSQEFSELTGWGKLGRLTSMVVAVSVLCAPAICFFPK